jgi:chromosome segregation ATPase
LEYENRRDIKGVVNTGQASLENETEQHNDREAELLRKKEELKFYQKELELTNASKVQEVRQQHEKQLVKLQQQFSESLAELEKRCEARLYRLKEDLELRRRMEVHEVEERKNKHINDLADNHKRAFGQMKSYYNEITGSNLQLIRDLQKQIETLKTRAIEHKDNLIEITKENQRLSEPLAVAKTEIAELQSSLKERIKDQMALRNARSRLASINRNAVEMRANQHHLEEQYLLAERERDQLFSSFEESVALVKQQSDFANLSLEQRLRVAEAETDKSAQQVQEIISAGKLDPTEMVRVMGSLNQMLTAKDDALTSIRFLVVKLKKTFNDALATYTAKMKELGVPTYEIESMGYNSERLPDGSTNAPSGLLVEG